MRETFVLLGPQGEGMESVVQAIEVISGRVLLSFPPHAVVALLPAERIDELRANPAARLVSTEEIALEGLEAASSAARMAVAAWNEHVVRRNRPPERLFEGLAWDAPGRLAPDPPPHVREMLRRREQEMQGDS